MTIKEDISTLEKRAKKIRRMVLDTVHYAGCGHTGGSLSAIEILTVLYFRMMNVDPENPAKIDRDRYVQSKGHASPAYYCTLVEKGFFPESELCTFDEINSRLQGHPCMKRTPGVDFSTGSLGQGLSVSIGMCLGRDRLNLNFNVYCLLGDGECQEGQIWEAAMYAGTHKIKRLIAIVDYNKVQLAETVVRTLDLEPFRDKWTAFGWHVLECDGHNVAELVDALENAKKQAEDGPVVLLAHTIKGKGVSFMEGEYSWHGMAPDGEQYRKAIDEIGECL